MAANPQTVDELARTVPRSRWSAATLDFIRRRPLGALGAGLILVMVAMAATAGFVAPYNPLENDYGAMLSAPSAEHWLGTDAYGRDVLTRILYGSRTALLVGLSASLLGASIGSVNAVACGASLRFTTGFRPSWSQRAVATRRSPSTSPSPTRAPGVR